MNAPVSHKIRNRTLQQITAANPDTSVWVSANAGTGKTGVLVDRISRLLLEGVEPERILCLTFTKAAAAEMANRLAELLSTWSALPDDMLREELRALGENPVDEDLLKRARRLFALTLEAPEGLRIRTIHSFCESLLGRFPLEAEISPDFRVMDERDQIELRLQARDTVFAEAESKGTAISAALRTLASLVDEAKFQSLIKEIDDKRAPFRAALLKFGGTTGMADAVYAALDIAPGTTSEVVIRDACTLDDQTEAMLNRLCAAWEQGSKGNQTTAATVRAWLAKPVEHRQLSWRADFVGAFLTKNITVLKNIVTKDADAADPEAKDLAVGYAEHLITIIDKLKAINIAAATAALIEIGATLIQAYEAIKQQRGQLDYDDLIERASQLLNSPSGISWVHYKLDGGIEHVLVDEAQDTSKPQWQVIDEIASDFFAGESRHEEKSDRARTVFAVGDEKQSIYSFQGADPALFGAMRDRFAERVTAVERAWTPVDMAESFRSGPAVLDMVDDVFDDPEAAKGLSFGGHKISHKSARPKQAGLVALWPKEEPGVDDADDDPWYAPVDHVGADSPPGRIAERIADTIKHWLDTKEMLPAQGRPIEPGDVLILLQKRRSLAELMVAALKERNIPVSGRDRMILPDQLVIKDLVALGRLTLLPNDDLNTAVVLKGPLVGLNEDELYKIAYDRKGTVLDALQSKSKENKRFKAAFEQITAWRARADFVRPFEFFSKILEAENGRKNLLAALGPDAADPIDDFLSAALDYERDHVPSMEGFLHWIETGAVEVKRDLEQGRNEVRVMTVHGAKGLQAEIVFLADACSIPAKQVDASVLWHEDDGLPLWAPNKDDRTADIVAMKEQRREAVMEEYRRLLYVAMTRAKDRLYVTGYTVKNAPKDDRSWYDMIEDAVRRKGTQIDAPDGHTAIIYEKPQDAEPDGGKSREDISVRAEQVPDWATSLPAQDPTPPQPLSPSRPDDEEPPVRTPLDPDDGQRFKRGNVVHALMQTLPELPSENRRHAAASYIARPLNGFSGDQQRQLIDEVMAVLEAPEIAHVFGPGSSAEVPITGTIETKDGPRVVAGQIDRLVFADAEVLIVDYKTNRPPPDRAEDVAPIYLRQMATYRAALQEIFPGTRIRAVLLWTDGPKWMELPDKILTPYTP